jgi:hypothetical protein
MFPDIKLSVEVDIWAFLATFYKNWAKLFSTGHAGYKYPVGYLLIWQHCFIWQC